MCLYSPHVSLLISSASMRSFSKWECIFIDSSFFIWKSLFWKPHSHFLPWNAAIVEFENSIKSIQLIKDEWQDGKGSPKQLTKEQEEQPPASQTAPSAWPDPDPNYCNSRWARRDKCELQKMPPVPRQREIQPTDLPNTRTWYLYFRHS